MRDFRSFAVWHKAHALTLKLYEATRSFPNDERFGLTSQLRRAVTSVPTNIAEGCGRGTEPDMKRFLQIAFGSASETEYLVLLAGDLKYLEEQHAQELLRDVQEIKRMLGSLIARITKAATLLADS